MIRYIRYIYSTTSIYNIYIQTKQNFMEICNYDCVEVPHSHYVAVYLCHIPQYVDIVHMGGINYEASLYEGLNIDIILCNDTRENRHGGPPDDIAGS